METTNKRVRIGVLYLPFGYETILEHFFARQVSRKDFSDAEKERLTPELRKLLEGQVQAILGDKVTDVKLTYSLRAGCSCPCSPGFCVSAVPTGKNSWDLGMDGWRGNPLLKPAVSNQPPRDRAVFFVNSDRTISVSTHEVEWRRTGRGRATKEYASTQLFSWILPGGRVAVKEATG